MNMKEYLKKADILGLAIVAGVLMAYSVRGIWTGYQTAGIVAGGVLIVVALALKIPDIMAGLRRRSTRFGINSATSVFLVVGILTIVNYLGAQHQKRVDMTTEKFYSLSDQSLAVAAEVQEPVRIKAFYPEGDYTPVRDLLQLYSGRNSRISFEFIDPDRQPHLAQQYSVTSYGDVSNPLSGETFRYGTLILEAAEMTERVEKPSEPVREEDITNALMRIVKGERKTVYFTEGHGEKGIDDSERSGYSQVRAGLETENYIVESVNLAVAGAVPEDASVLVLAGPASEPFPNELELIDEFLERGGSVLILLDPPPAASLADFLKNWSIEAGNNFVVDASGVGRLFGAGPDIPLVTPPYGSHPITERFSLMTFFPLVRSITPAEPASDGVFTEELLRSSERSWGETDMTSAELQFDEGRDLEGPVTLAVAATKDQGEEIQSRLVVFGDSDFASNAFFTLQGNGNLFMNTVNWLAQDESFISIRPKDPEDRRLTMTEAQGRMVAYVAVVLLPAAILIAGVSVWVKRRK